MVPTIYILLSIDNQILLLVRLEKIQMLPSETNRPSVIVLRCGDLKKY
jgi:hypothetical protein